MQNRQTGQRACYSPTHKAGSQLFGIAGICQELVVLSVPYQFAGYVGEESPVEGCWVEEEKSSCS